MDIDFEVLKRESEKDESLREYQQKSKQKVYDAWSRGHSVMLQMPTGTGKTKTFVSIIKDISNYSQNYEHSSKVLILVHRTELIDQIDKELGSKYGLNHGIIQAGNKEQAHYSIQLASVQTLSRRLDNWTDKEFDFIIVDEAHHVTAASYQNIISAFPSARILGVTATPVRLNGEGFTGTFEELIVSPSVKEFIENGWLSQYDYYSVPRSSFIQREIDGIKKFSQGDYAESEMERVCDNDKIRAQVVQAYLDFANGKRGIVYTINKKHNNSLCEQFQAHGINTVAIDSDTPKEEREVYIEKFRRGEIQIICNVNLFTEGFDCPDIEFIQLARPTKSLALYLQQVGRGLRISENKKKTIFLDNVGLYNRFGFPSSRRRWREHFKGILMSNSNTNDSDTDDDTSNKTTSTRRQNLDEGHEKISLILSPEDKAYIAERTKQLWDIMNEYNDILIDPYNVVIQDKGLDGISKTNTASNEFFGDYHLKLKDIEKLRKLSGKNYSTRSFDVYNKRYEEIEREINSSLSKEKKKNRKKLSALKNKIKEMNFSVSDLYDIIPSIIDKRVPRTPKCYEGSPITYLQLLGSYLRDDRKDGKQVSTFGKSIIDTGFFDETVSVIENNERMVKEILDRIINDFR